MKTYSESPFCHSNRGFLSGLQLFSKLQAVKAEIQDIQGEHIKERQEYEQTQNELTRDLKLKYGASISAWYSCLLLLAVSCWL